jgi:corrinoid protein of di/trimethylamine methyltransferase
MSNEELFGAMAQSVYNGKPDQAAELASQAIELGLDPLEVINCGYLPGIQEIGECFARGDMFLPDLIMGSEAMKAAIRTLEPELQRRGTQRQILGKVVLGTVKGDIHEVGKNLVGTMLSANGFEVYDLGVNVPTDRFVDSAREFDADIVGLSALLTTTMVNQRIVIQALRQAGLRCKVMVGGAPVTQSWADGIGADGYSEDAGGAVILAKRLVGANQQPINSMKN